MSLAAPKHPKNVRVKHPKIPIAFVFSCALIANESQIAESEGGASV
jgi:hypothetical protein